MRRDASLSARAAYDDAKAKCVVATDVYGLYYNDVNVALRGFSSAWMAGLKTEFEAEDGAELEERLSCMLRKLGSWKA
jgi:hypothetical protein